MRRSAQEMDLLARHADLYARALGHRGAVRATGIPSGLMSRLRRRVHGGPPPRLPNPGNTGHGKLNLAKAREIRARRANGETTVALGAEFGVVPQTIGRVFAGNLYPEPA